MKSTLGRRVAALAGGVAIIAFAAACGTSGNQSPSSSTTPTTTSTTTTTAPPSSSAPAPAPTEKNISPTGGNLFSPQVIAPPAPTEPPGVHRHTN